MQALWCEELQAWNGHHHFPARMSAITRPLQNNEGLLARVGGGKPPIIYRLFFVQWWCSNSGRLIREEKPGTRLTLASFSAWQGQTLGTHTDEQTVGSHCLSTRRRTNSHMKVVRQREAANVLQWYNHWMIGRRFSFTYFHGLLYLKHLSSCVQGVEAFAPCGHLQQFNVWTNKQDFLQPAVGQFYPEFTTSQYQTLLQSNIMCGDLALCLLWVVGKNEWKERENYRGLFCGEKTTRIDLIVGKWKCSRA